MARSYNSVVYSSQNVNTYSAIIAPEAFVSNTSMPTHDFNVTSCFKTLAGHDADDLRDKILAERFQRLSVTDCLNEYAVDFLSDRRTVIGITSDSNANNSLYFSGYGYPNNLASINYKTDPNHAALSTSSEDAIKVANDGSGMGYDWICDGDIGSMDRELICHPEYFTTDHHPFKMVAQAESNRDSFDLALHTSSCDVRPTTFGLDLNFTIDYCLSENSVENYQLIFYVPIAVAVIICSLVKLICMFLIAYEDRHDLFLTIGDAISSYLQRPDPTTANRCMLSRSMAIPPSRAFFRKVVDEYHWTSSFPSHPRMDLPALPPPPFPQKPSEYSQLQNFLNWASTSSPMEKGPESFYMGFYHDDPSRVHCRYSCALLRVKVRSQIGSSERL
jgi:hypothetical protein